MNYLKNSKEIQNKLRDLYSQKGVKWGIVGFVGYDAAGFLPENIADLSIICWAKPGSTNPDGIRSLIKKGVSVYFCDKLHQKVYWVENIGLIVSSSNLSKNGLGKDGLHEFGVFCDDKKFDINDILSTLEYKKVSTATLSKLDVGHTRKLRNTMPATGGNASARKTPSFYEVMQEKHPKKWKIVTWSERRKDDKKIQKAVEENFHTQIWENDHDVEPNKFQIGDFVLQLKTNDKGFISKTKAREDVEWLLVDHIVKNSKNEHIIVQVKKIGKHTPPPFELDSDFETHLKTAFNKTEWDGMLKYDGSVKSAFCKTIKSLYD